MRTLTLLGALLALSACKGGDTPVDSSVPDDSGGGEVDADGDGVPAGEDCDDDDAGVYPGATELCDDVDNNCDGAVDEGLIGTFYQDSDGDGYGDEGSSVEACVAPEGYVDQAGDCQDDDAAFYPGAPEEDCADPSDYNCDGSVAYEDNDADGFAACEECDDADASVNPDAAEVCDEVDQDCDGSVDEGVTTSFYQDADGDGFGDADFSAEACAAPSGYVADATDCDDTRGDTFPGADEYCDSVDTDCDGTLDEDDALDALTWYADADADGFGDAASTAAACSQPSGYVGDNSDCDDTSAATFPGADEYCDGVDTDCDGTLDEDDALDAGTWYADVDGDSYGDAASATASCSQPSGYVADDTDCDDGDNSVSPAGTEACDGVDEDCDSLTDEGLLGSGQSCATVSCAAVLADQPSASDGSYWLDPTGSGTAVEYECDMSTDGGGWTLVLDWNREDEGDGLTEWGNIWTENYNDMSRWREQTNYLQWCDMNTSSDALDYELPVDIPNGGELLWSLKEHGRDYFYQSATWYSAVTASGDEEIICSDNIDNLSLWDSTEASYFPGYTCSLNDLDWRWDYSDQQSTMTGEVSSLRFTSLHNDSSCGDESRIYKIETWVR